MLGYSSSALVGALFASSYGAVVGYGVVLYVFRVFFGLEVEYYTHLGLGFHAHCLI